MNYKSEKLLIKISAVLAIINLALLLIFGIALEAFKNQPEFIDFLGRYGVNIPEKIFRFSYIVMLLLRVVVIIVLFNLANKLDRNNYKTTGILSIVIGIVSFRWLLGYISSILLIVAGIMILMNSRKTQS